MNLRTLCIAVCTLLPLCLSYAQPRPFPDSLRVEIPDHQSIVVFDIRDYARDKDVITSLPQRLSAIVDQITSSLSDADRKIAHTILVNYSREKEKPDDYQITITRKETNVTEVSVKGNAVVQLLPPGWEVRIHDKRYQAYVYAPDLERLGRVAQVSLDPVRKHLDGDPASTNQTRQGFISRLILAGGNVTAEKISHRGVQDMLELSAAAGAGLLQERFYPEFSLITAIHLSNRYRTSAQRFQLSWELKLFSGRNSEGSFDYQPASFLNLSWCLNFAKERPKWTGLGVGYMLTNKSDVFTGRTMKIFFESDIGSSKLNLVPELYLTDGLKRTHFGLKLNYKF